MLIAVQPGGLEPGGGGAQSGGQLGSGRYARCLGLPKQAVRGRKDQFFAEKHAPDRDCIPHGDTLQPDRLKAGAEQRQRGQDYVAKHGTQSQQACGTEKNTFHLIRFRSAAAPGAGQRC